MRRGGNPSLGKLRMPKSKRPGSLRTFIFDKRFCAVAATIAAVVGGLVYFRDNLPMLAFSTASSHTIARDLPNGSILMPYSDGVCHLNAIDTKTGRISDDGLVDCKDAADKNTAAWKSFVEEQKASEIRKSFRHE